MLIYKLSNDSHIFTTVVIEIIIKLLKLILTC